MTLSAEWGNQIYSEYNNMLQINDIQDIYFYDTRDDLDQGLWRTDSAKSWFKEPQNPSDDFLGMDFDQNRWILSDAEGYLTQDNKIIFYKPPSDDVFHSSEYTSNWEISGDFDFQIDFELITWNPSTFQHESSIRLEFWVDDQNKCKLWRYIHTDDNYWGETWVNDVINHGREPSGIGDENIGKLRLTRNGYYLSMWRWDTSSGTWQRVKFRSDFSNQAGHLKIAFTNYYTEMELFADNFIINSGNSSFNDYGSVTRGETDEFPEQSVLIRTSESLDIIDISNYKCWMRFTGINDNLGAIAGTSDCVFAKNGVAYTTWDGDYRGLVKIDFINDQISYLSHTYNQQYSGNISQRNFNKPWVNITPSFDLGTDHINDISGTNLNLHEHIGLTSQAGVHVITDQQSITHSTLSSDFDNIFFDLESNLFCGTLNEVLSFSRNYLYQFFLHSNSINIEYSEDLAASENYIFIATTSGVRKLNRNSFSDTGITYSNALGLDPTSSNNCIGIVVLEDNLFVGTNGSDGKISCVDFVLDDYLFTVPEDLYISSFGNQLAGGQTPQYNRNLFWGTPEGTNRFFGSTENLSIIDIIILNGNAVLNWNKIIQASLYNIYRSTDPEFEISQQHFYDSVSENEFIDSNISNDIEMFYKVTWED